MYCSAIFHKVDFDNCRVCAGEHTMTERRLRYLSSTCHEFGKCGVVWKVFYCTAQDKWQLTVNEQAHARGVLPCTAEHRPVVTQPMKADIAAQDEIGNAPRIILAHLKKQANIKPSKGGWPELSQIQNALKVHRRSKGTKNSIKAWMKWLALAATIQNFSQIPLFCLDLSWARMALFMWGPARTTLLSLLG
ncbi:hypothetical protein PHYSODRAFT_527039 [Phytophthora sojae]|uniref:Uncharacterized protein n=1 Tax=Phytophthora sojae (strain P6497) TaxID=1094619 RepID=G5A9H6_PHYSP|nr:hypothetical protein PHYSODRAFT_527039 [Phytophthora sojae]EGZ08551.1 hypothetical protein PHYSODRAFT_527039 [Phytophthora sojae]|eukprot:XP_009536723.1 hypothetical protein PHYSODRAFT_527039 [Phytophthora sojae]